MGTGREIRMGRVFGADGRTVIVAMDHLAVFDRPIAALGDGRSLVRAVRDGGGDAVLLTRGTLSSAADQLGDLATILSVPLGVESARSAPEYAIRAGVDMVKVVLYPFTPGFEDTFSQLDSLTAACDRWDIPVLVETVPGGFHAERSSRTADVLAAAARIAVELGASAVKTFLPRCVEAGAGEETNGGIPGVDLDGLRRLCRYVPVPVVILGGDPTDLNALADQATLAVEAGSAGVAVGRNVWGHPDPAAAVASLCDAVHRPRARTTDQTRLKVGQR